jgi:glycerate kinase
VSAKESSSCRDRILLVEDPAMRDDVLVSSCCVNEIQQILVACDKFKGSLSAPEACAAIARGLARRWPQAVIEECPIADGGEGFAAALEGPLGGRWVEAPCHDALGRPIRARYLVAGSNENAVAVMEVAAASGMWRIAANDRDILRANTFGTGELIRHADRSDRLARTSEAGNKRFVSER